MSGEIESQKIEVRSCQIELDSRDEIHLEEIKSGEEKISEHLETIAGLEISNTELNSELDNQKDITSGLKEKGNVVDCTLVFIYCVGYTV